MTGPQHYLAAEELLVASRDSKNAAAALAKAQVHATLALAAATALNSPADGGMGRGCRYPVMAQIVTKGAPS